MNGGSQYAVHPKCPYNLSSHGPQFNVKTVDTKTTPQIQLDRGALIEDPLLLPIAL